MATKTEAVFGVTAEMFIWIVLLEWMRYRSWKRTKDTGFSPGTQQLAMLGTAGLAIGIVGVIGVLFFWR